MIKLMSRKGIDTSKARVLVLGLTFKENCPDLRNTRVTDIIDELQEYGIRVEVHDPWVNAAEALKEYGIRLIDTLPEHGYAGIVIAVAHRQFATMQAADFRRLCCDNAVIYDVKNILPAGLADGCL
jgi:UDP-N-acetyl-D-galactosamine dehydrogenase